MQPYLQSSYEVVLELAQLGHVGLDEEASVEDLPPAGQGPQIESQRPDQPDRLRRESNVLQVFSDGHGLAGLGDEDDDRFCSGQFPEKGLDFSRKFGLVRFVLEDVRDSNPDRRGLGQEGLDGRPAGREDGQFVRVHLERDVHQRLKINITAYRSNNLLSKIILISERIK